MSKQKTSRPKPRNPYTDLQSEFREFLNEFHRRLSDGRDMFAPLVPPNDINLDVVERTHAADQLGYEVVLVPSKKNGARTVTAVYRKKVADILTPLWY